MDVGIVVTKDAHQQADHPMQQFIQVEDGSNVFSYLADGL
jgi:hypothetical protein